MKRAFSLLEVMVALGVVGMLAGAVFSFMFDLLRGRETLIEASRDAVAAAAIVERVESDLFTAVAGGAGGAGVDGSSTSLRIEGRAVTIPVRSGDVIADIISAELRYDETRGVLEGSRDGGAFETISDRVRACRFRYFDGRRWRQSYDSSSTGALPVAIEIALWFGEVDTGDLDDLEDPFEDPFEFDPFDEPAPFGESDEPAVNPLDAEPVTLPERDPDLLRVMIVPDGPVAAWSNGA